MRPAKARASRTARWLPYWLEVSSASWTRRCRPARPRLPRCWLRCSLGDPRPSSGAWRGNCLNVLVILLCVSLHFMAGARFALTRLAVALSAEEKSRTKRREQEARRQAEAKDAKAATDAKDAKEGKDAKDGKD